MAIRYKAIVAPVLYFRTAYFDKLRVTLDYGKLLQTKTFEGKQITSNNFESVRYIGLHEMKVPARKIASGYKNIFLQLFVVCEN